MAKINPDCCVPRRTRSQVQVTAASKDMAPLLYEAHFDRTFVGSYALGSLISVLLLVPWVMSQNMVVAICLSPVLLILCLAAGVLGFACVKNPKAITVSSEAVCFRGLLSHEIIGKQDIRSVYLKTSLMDSAHGVFHGTGDKPSRSHVSLMIERKKKHRSDMNFYKKNSTLRIRLNQYDLIPDDLLHSIKLMLGHPGSSGETAS